MNPIDALILDDDKFNEVIEEQENSDIVVFGEGKEVNGSAAVKVIDGDTAVPQIKDEYGKWIEDKTKKRWRLKDVGAPEVAHFKSTVPHTKSTLTGGDIGGLHAKEILKHVLKTEDIGLASEPVASKGAGADTRDQVELRINSTGQTLSNFLLSKGLADTNTFSSESDYLAKSLGDLNRKINPMLRDPYEDLRENKPINTYGVKEYADDYRQFRYNPDKYHGVSFYARDRDSSGYTTGFGILSTALAQGSNTVAGLLGGGAASLGKLYGDETYLETWGDKNRLVSEYRAQLLPDQEFGSLDNVDGVADFLKWTVVKGGESAPFMAAIIAGSVAAPFVGSAAATGAAALGAGTGVAAAIGTGTSIATGFLPSAILQAGEVYNQLDPEAQTKENAAYSLMLGTAAGALDIIGLDAIKYAIKPSSLLNRFSRKEAFNKVSKEIGVSTDVLEGRYKEAFIKSSAEVLDAAAKSQALDARMKEALVSKLFGGIKRTAIAGGTEAVTEAGQELLTTLGSKSLNIQALFEDAERGDPEAQALVDKLESKLQVLDDGSGYVPALSIAGVLSEALGERGSDLQKQIIEAAVAGGVLGAGISGGTSIAAYGIDKGKNASYKALGLEADPSKLFTKEQKIFYENRNDGTEEQQQDALARDLNGKLSINGQHGVSINPSKQTDTSIKLAKKHKQKRGFVSQTIKDITSEGKLPSASNTFVAAKQGFRNLITVPVRAVENIANAKYLKDSRGIRLLASSIGGLTIGYGGKAFEKARSSFVGHLHHMYNVDMAASAFGFNQENNDHRAAYSELQYTYSRLNGKYDKDTNKEGLGRPPTVEELKAAYNPIEGSDATTTAVVQQFKDSLNDDNIKVLGGLDAQLRVRAEQQRNAINIAREKEGLPPVKNLEGWHYKHRGISRARAALDPTGFTKWLEDILVDTPSVTKPKEVARVLSRNIIDGSTTDQEFTLLFGEGVLGSGKKRTLNLAQRPGFNKWAEVDMFKTLDQASNSAARHAVHLDYFGHKNRKIGAMLELAQAELLASPSNYDPKQVQADLEQLAAIVGDTIDAADNNYNRIQNEALAKAQSNILTYTTISGMLLAAPASLPEFAAIAVGLRGSDAWNHWMSTVGKQSYAGLKRGMTNIINKRVNPLEPLVFNEFYEVQQEGGIPDDTEFLQRKFGSEQVFNVPNESQGPVGRYLTEVKDKMFYANLLQGMTQVQRAVATDVALRFVMEQLSIIHNISDGGVRNAAEFDNVGSFRINPKTQGELDAYIKLQQANINPETLLKAALQIQNLTPDTDAHNKAKAAFKQEVLKGVAKFVDIRIQNPGAANRPLIMQDPHFALLTQFNGFLSAVTTQLVPKLWNEEFARTWRAKTPALSYGVFGAVIAMFALNGLGNWLKEMIKHWQFMAPTESKYLAGHKNLQRAILGSGAFGQYEKLLDILYPLYPQPGEGPAKRTFDTFAGSAGRLTGQVADLLTPAKSEDGVEQFDEFVGDALRLVPWLSQITAARSGLQHKITGTVSGETHERDIFGVR